MANIGTVAGATGRSAGTLFGSLFRIKIAYIFIIVLFIIAISTGISNGGGIEIIKSLGERFFNLTQGLQSTSIEIINNGAVFTGYFAFALILWALFSNAYMIYLWLKLFSYLAGKSFLSNESQGFINNCLAVLFFLILQIFYLFLFGLPLEGQTNFDLFMTPIYAFRDFFTAVVLIFSSTSFQNAVESNTIKSCLNSSVCVI